MYCLLDYPLWLLKLLLLLLMMKLLLLLLMILPLLYLHLMQNLWWRLLLLYVAWLLPRRLHGCVRLRRAGLKRSWLLRYQDWLVAWTGAVHKLGPCLHQYWLTLHYLFGVDLFRLLRRF